MSRTTVACALRRPRRVHARILVSVLAGALVGALVGAEPVLAQRVAPPTEAGLDSPATLDGVVAYARRHSPDLNVARLRVDSAAAERTIAREYANPSLSATPGNPSQYAVAVPVDLGPPRLLRTRAARQGEAAAAFDSADALRQVVFNARAAFYDVLLADALARLARQQRDIFHDLLAADSVRLRSGDIAQQDVARSELELARANARLARAEAGGRAARVALQAVVGITHPDTAFRVAGALQYRDVLVGGDTLLALAQRSRADLLATAERVRQSETLRSLATAQRLPAPSVSAVYQPAQPFASGKRYAVGVGVQLPVWNWFGGERARARAGVAIAQESRRRAEAQVTADVTAAIDAFNAARAFAQSYEGGLLAKATDNLAASRYAYRSGATSLVDLLSAVNSFIDVNTEYLTAAHDYWVSAYALDRAVGVDLIPGS